MEGTHCTLLLQKPITELCYISFYLPRGQARGFSYKGAVTLDKSNKALHNCYQVREGPDIISLNLQPSEHPGDIFFKETPTKDILTELYKLTAERERLLTNLLNSEHILGISMGKQEGKLPPELSVSLPPEDDSFQNAGDWQVEPAVGCLNRRRLQGNIKPRRFGGRRDSQEELQQNKVRRKGLGVPESSPQMGKEQTCSSDPFSGSLALSNLWFPEEKGNLLPSRVPASSPWRAKSCSPEDPSTLDFSDPYHGSLGMASEAAALGRKEQVLKGNYVVSGDGGTGEPRRESPRLMHQHITRPTSHQAAEQHPEAEKGQREKTVHRTCRKKKAASKLVVKALEPSPQVHREVKAHARDVYPAVQAEFTHQDDLQALPEAQVAALGSSQQDKQQLGDGSRWPLTKEHTLAGTQGAVNKVLRKVIEREKLDEAIEGKRLGFPLKTVTTHTVPNPRSKRREDLLKSGHKTLFLDLHSSMGPDSPGVGGAQERPASPELATLNPALNNSSFQFGAHTRMSPVPSPLSPRLTDGQKPHRISQLTPQSSSEEAVNLDDSPAGRSSTFLGSPSTDILEPPFCAKVTETKGASLASLRAGQPPFVPGDSLEKTVGPGKTTALPQQQSPPGISSEGFPLDYFTEQTATKDPPNRDGGPWVLGYRTGPAYSFLLHDEREKPNRNDLYRSDLDLYVSGNLHDCDKL